VWLGLRGLGAGSLLATGAVHLDLYLTGYRTIPTIGALFLLQVLSALALAIAVLLTGRRLVAAAGAGFALSTLAGYLVSLRTPLFGFREARTTAGIAAGVIETIGFAALVALAIRPSGAQPGKDAARLRHALVRVPESVVARWFAGALTLVMAGTLALSLAATSARPVGSDGSGARLGVRTVAGVQVATDARGFTLYWFAQDSPTASACTGDCLAYWTPVTGTPAAGTGVTGTLGTIHRGDGTLQATYDSHPLYTYIGDSGPGESNGNNINLNGGLWHEMTVSGTT
jgi:predicted lipoprotein with Yx(FWY)xxD motif